MGWENIMKQFSERETAALQAANEKSEAILSPHATKNNAAVREYKSKYDTDVLRTQYAIDSDKIIHSPLYNRGNDKTQVFSFYRNDDITRRSSHVQLVSRIGRTLGKALGLNLDLIEAIAIGHDVGHTPFGHKGEDFLRECYHAKTGKYFNHNVHSVRVLQKITRCNLTLQTLDGILCHCGEKAFEKYEPADVTSFEEHNKIIENCYNDETQIGKLRPSTLEGCAVRISDMIAYIGKDRQDASKVKLGVKYPPSPLGSNNPEIINSILVDIISNSWKQPYLSMSDDVFVSLTEMLEVNNELIYQQEEVVYPYYAAIQPMMELLYNQFLEDLTNDDHSSMIYQHYLNGRVVGDFYRHPKKRFIQKDIHDLNDIVVDFIASMTDDYFLDIFEYLYPDHELSKDIQYIEYFDNRFTAQGK